MATFNIGKFTIGCFPNFSKFSYKSNKSYKTHKYFHLEFLGQPFFQPCVFQTFRLSDLNTRHVTCVHVTDSIEARIAQGPRLESQVSWLIPENSLHAELSRETNILLPSQTQHSINNSKTQSTFRLSQIFATLPLLHLTSYISTSALPVELVDCAHSTRT